MDDNVEAGAASVANRARSIVIHHPVDRPGYRAPTCSVIGHSRSSLAQPAEFSAWVLVAELAAGAQLHWQQDHPAEAIYVGRGQLEIDGVLCDDGGAMIVEAGAQPTVHVLEDTRVVHFGTWDADRSSVAPASPSVHVSDRRGVASLDDDANSVVYFADSTCPTCDITFFTNSSPGPRTSRSHHHTADEIIHVFRGELRVGPLIVSEGMSIAIPAGLRYGFQTPGSEFINFRAGSSYYCRPNERPLLETIESVGAMRV